MNLSTPPVIVNKPLEELFQKFSNVENYQELMPDGFQKFEFNAQEKTFDIQLNGLPKVGMKMTNLVENQSLHFESPNPSLKYSLDVFFSAKSSDQTQVEFKLDSSLNPMLEMMAKRPLEKFLESMSQKVQQV